MPMPKRWLHFAFVWPSKLGACGKTTYSLSCTLVPAIPTPTLTQIQVRLRFGLGTSKRASRWQWRRWERLIKMVAAAFFCVDLVWLGRWNEVTLTSHSIETENALNSTIAVRACKPWRKIVSYKLLANKEVKHSRQLVLFLRIYICFLFDIKLFATFCFFKL